MPRTVAPATSASPATSAVTSAAAATAATTAIGRDPSDVDAVVHHPIHTVYNDFTNDDDHDAKEDEDMFLKEEVDEREVEVGQHFGGGLRQGGGGGHRSGGRRNKRRRYDVRDR